MPTPRLLALITGPFSDYLPKGDPSGQRFNTSFTYLPTNSAAG